jgi:ribonucleoside-diphosphate reductase alpha chain
MENELLELKEKGQAPAWMTEEAYITLKGGYLQADETPVAMYHRVSDAAASRLNKPEMASKFFDAIFSNFLCLATPCASNMGTNRGLPISCFSSSVTDTTDDIFQSYREVALLSKYGGGMGIYWGNVRGRGAPIKGGSFSEGIVPWLKVEEATVQAISQAGVRRGAIATYLDIEHLDADEFIDIRRPTGDQSRRCLSSSFHHAVTIGDSFMEEMLAGDKDKRALWGKLLKTRVEQGEPYVMFRDNANRKLPQAYVNNNLKVSTSNLCSEIFLHTDKDHTFVCCLSSLNLARYDEWKDTDLIETSIWFLDGVMEEFIQKAKLIPGFEKAVRFAEKSRALGLGVLGWHTLLQSKMIAFDSFEAMRLNAEIFSKMQRESLVASQNLAKEYGEPQWCRGTGVRNSHTMAIAPTVSNSLISGGVSQGIEPIIANYYAQKSAKGTFIRKNPALERHLHSIGKDTFDVWQQINSDMGSVKNLSFLSKEEKDVFLTAREINQFSIIRQAAQRQRWIDQGQSVNLFFMIPKNLQDTEEKNRLARYIHEIHVEAWKTGIKSLYYLRSEAVLKGDSIFRESSDCKSCEG